MSKDSNKRAEVAAFIRTYFSEERKSAEPNVCERKGFTEFKRRMAEMESKAKGSDLHMTEEQAKALYQLATGESATYQRKPVSNLRPEKVNKALAAVALRAYDLLDSYPTSVTDLCEKAKSEKLRDSFRELRGYYWGGDNYAGIRQCFKELAAREWVGMQEVKTCGRVHIRVYYRL